MDFWITKDKVKEERSKDNNKENEENKMNKNKKKKDLNTYKIHFPVY